MPLKISNRRRLHKMLGEYNRSQPLEHRVKGSLLHAEVKSMLHDGERVLTPYLRIVRTEYKVFVCFRIDQRWEHFLAFDGTRAMHAFIRELERFERG